MVRIQLFFKKELPTRINFLNTSMMSASNESLQSPPPDNETETTNGMLKILTELRENGLFCDGTLKIDTGEQFRVHRAVLAVSSPFFRALFSHTPDEVIPIPEISLEVMKLVLQFCYTRRCNVDETTIEDLLPIADRLLIPSLKEHCCNFLGNELHPQNCIGIWRLARFYFCKDLADKSFRFLLKNFHDVSICEEWLEMTSVELEEVCRDDLLNCKSEEEVFKAISIWLTFDPERNQQAAEIFRTVRLDLLPLQFLNDVVYQNKVPTALPFFEANFRRRLEQNCNASDGYNSRLRTPHEVLLAIGGWTGHQPNDVVEAFDVRAKCWKVLDAKIDQGPRAYHSCVTLNGQELFIIGGYNGVDYFNSVRNWNLATGCWKEAAPMNSRRCYVSTVALNGAIYAFGGYDGQFRTNSAERYNPATNQWSYIKPMNFQRSDAGAAVLDDYVYVCGGFNGTTCQNSVERYNPSTDTWTNVASMESQRSGVSVVAYHGSLYALGGFNGRRRVDTVERYDPNLNVWRPVATMKTPRSNFATGVIEDQLFVIGGYHSSETIAKVEMYDSLKNEWIETVPMKTNRSALTAMVLTDLPNIAQYLRRDDNDDEGYASGEGEAEVDEEEIDIESGEEEPVAEND